MKTKKFTILHSNDMHGDFLAEMRVGKTKLIGGLALLSGYINKVRKEEENVLYVIAGDMVQGSLIDSEYKGVSTMGLMNYLAPDVVSLGNHEFDYGLSHLLFLEKVANFPIVNANLYIKPYNKRLMRPYLILSKAGFDILFTGIITEKVMDSIKMDPLISSFITLQDAATEIGKICNAYKNDDIDLTVLLTHIGYDSDLELAGMLKPEWGVDLIIGGHSHTILEKPAERNGVLIAQAGVGTDQIGRFDIVVDDDTNSIVDYTWRLIPIDENIAEPDEALAKYLATYQQEVDQKYNSIVCKLAVEHTHPLREIETSLGNLFADAFADNAECHVMLVASGSIRTKELGPLVTMRDLLTCFPYNDVLTRYTVTGEQLTNVFLHIMRKDNRNGEGECYQVNGRVRATYCDGEKRLVSLKIDGDDVDPTKHYTICLQNYHAKNSKAYLNVSPEELSAIKTKVVSTSSFEVLEEYLKNNQNTSRHVEGRLVFQQ
jgi:5'-nucleotidase